MKLRIAIGLLIVRGALNADAGGAEPAFAFRFAGDAVHGMQFAPDGRKLVLVTFETKRRHLEVAQFSGRIYDVASGKMEREIKTGAWVGAWSHNGSVLALARANAVDIDLFDCRTWKIKQTVHITYPKDFFPPELSRLCFDRSDNLYVAEFNDSFDGVVEVHNAWLDGGESSRKESSPRMWWKVGDRWSPGPTLFGCCTTSSGNDSQVPLMAYDLCVAAGPRGPRLAVSYWRCLAQILDVGGRSGEAPSVDPASTVSVRRPYLKLTPDGKQLVTYEYGKLRITPGGAETREPPELRVFRVGDDRVELIRSRAVEAPLPRALGAPQVLEVSNNGQVAAYCARQVVGIVRIPSCDPMLLIPHNEEGAATAIVFSPDSRSLAVADKEKKEVRFYRIQK
ncbi:MAG TPA: hypothetical protein VGP76_18985 [Planctomycetaceae bacterium]|jgi:hypothetical protein|nr:hypothetical protein [Planctomycetaceae bacterium]